MSLKEYKKEINLVIPNIPFAIEDVFIPNRRICKL